MALIVGVAGLVFIIGVVAVTVVVVVTLQAITLRCARIVLIHYVGVIIIVGNVVSNVVSGIVVVFFCIVIGCKVKGEG